MLYVFENLEIEVLKAKKKQEGYYYEILECVEDPDAVYEGKYEELIGMKEIRKISIL